MVVLWRGERRFKVQGRCTTSNVGDMSDTGVQVRRPMSATCQAFAAFD